MLAGLSMFASAGASASGQASVPARRPIPVITPRYFSVGTFSAAHLHEDSLLVYALSKDLADAREPSFFTPRSLPAYRFAIVGAWGLVRLIRLERSDSGYVLVRKLTAADTSVPSQVRLEVADSTCLPTRAVADFERAATTLWTQPLFDNSVALQVDGDGWVIEARDPGRHPVLLRSTAMALAPPLAEMRRVLNALSGDFLSIGITSPHAP